MSASDLQRKLAKARERKQRRPKRNNQDTVEEKSHYDHKGTRAARKRADVVVSDIISGLNEIHRKGQDTLDIGAETLERTHHQKGNKR